MDERSLATAMTLFASNTMRGIQGWRSSARSVQSNRRATDVFQSFRSLLLHLKPGWMKASVHMRLTEKSRIKRSVVCAGRLGSLSPLDTRFLVCPSVRLFHAPSKSFLVSLCRGPVSWCVAVVFCLLEVGAPVTLTYREKPLSPATCVSNSRAVEWVCQVTWACGVTATGDQSKHRPN